MLKCLRVNMFCCSHSMNLCIYVEKCFVKYYPMYVMMQEGLKQCLADFRKDLPWVERLDLTNLPAEDPLSKVEGKVPNVTNGEVNADDDFQREMFLYVTYQPLTNESLLLDSVL